MTVGEIIRFLAPFYTTWDMALAQEYVRKFELSVRTKIRHLSNPGLHGDRKHGVGR